MRILLKPIRALQPEVFSTPGRFRSFSRLKATTETTSLSATDPSSPAPSSSLLKNFISNIIDADIASGKHGGRVLTRFPPEPNGYLHLGHAKSVNLNFLLAKHYQGKTNMRFDDTNPAKEDLEYVRSILDDVRWLVTGDTQADPPPWEGAIRHASDYFQVIYETAEYLIRQGLAYVDHLTAEEIRAYRGNLLEPGKDSPYRNRSIEENLQLFHRMKRGEFQEGDCVLRAKIDMSSPNMNLRDPTLYRIKTSTPHPITGSTWCIYPMYDFAHAISDAMEGITHSLCTLEFSDHRPLYDWTVDQFQASGLSPFPPSESSRPRQYEFSRLNVQYTVLSKRKLIQLVNEGHVTGWDDPRLPTISGLRRRGYTAEILRLFCDRVGVSKAENNIDLTVLEDCAREIFDEQTPRAFAIERPLKVRITNLPSSSDYEELFDRVENHPKRVEELGYRSLHFTPSLFINREDFFDTGPEGKIPIPKGFKRLLPGGQVRLKYAYVITCDQVIRDPQTGEATELLCSYHPETRAGKTPEGMKKVRGIIQWLSEKDAVPVTFHLYDRLFRTASPGSEQPDGDFLKDLHPDSLQIVTGAMVEKNVIDPLLQKEKKKSTAYQFERLGYFLFDEKDSDIAEKRFVFNRVVTLKDGWKP